MATVKITYAIEISGAPDFRIETMDGLFYAGYADGDDHELDIDELTAIRDTISKILEVN